MDTLEYLAARIEMAYEREFRDGTEEDILRYEDDLVAIRGQMYDIWH